MTAIMQDLTTTIKIINKTGCEVTTDERNDGVDQISNGNNGVDKVNDVADQVNDNNNDQGYKHAYNNARPPKVNDNADSGHGLINDDTSIGNGADEEVISPGAISNPSPPSTNMRSNDIVLPTCCCLRPLYQRDSRRSRIHTILLRLCRKTSASIPNQHCRDQR